MLYLLYKLCYITAYMNIAAKNLSYKTRIAKRHLLIATEKQNCSDVLGSIKHGESVYAFTGGQFSFINVLEHLLDITGAADVKIMTWSAGDADLQYARKFLESKRIKDIKFLIDFSFPTRQPAYCQRILELFPMSVKATNLHAKMIVVSNDKWNFTVRTSMNLNHNKRFENLEVVEGKEITDFHNEIFDTIWDGSQFVDIKLKAGEYKKTGDIKFGGEVDAVDFDFGFKDFDVI